MEKRRLDSIDFLRGVVMVLMALDHTRDLFANSPVDPADLTKTYPALFFTRWITHFCAPVFGFLAGTGAYLYGRRPGRTTAELSRYLWTRGLWIAFLELTWVRVAGLFMPIDFSLTIGLTLWAIGLSMVVLAALVYLKPGTILGIGVAVICLHNLTDNIHSTNWIWAILHDRQLIKMTANHAFLPQYGLLPWIGIVAAGYGYGPWIKNRKTGFLLTAAFVVLRAINVYGDPVKWTGGLLSFLNLSKYPPSLLFTLMALGPALILLSYTQDDITGWRKPFVVFGRVPLFYYLIHLPLIHLAAYFIGPLSLPWIYMAWITAVIILYPVCKWYEAVKRSHPDWGWLTYF